MWWSVGSHAGVCETIVAVCSAPLRSLRPTCNDAARNSTDCATVSTWDCVAVAATASRTSFRRNTESIGCCCAPDVSAETHMANANEVVAGRPDMLHPVAAEALEFQIENRENGPFAGVDVAINTVPVAEAADGGALGRHGTERVTVVNARRALANLLVRNNLDSCNRGASG